MTPVCGRPNLQALGGARHAARVIPTNLVCKLHVLEASLSRPFRTFQSSEVVIKIKMVMTYEFKCHAANCFIITVVVTSRMLDMIFDMIWTCFFEKQHNHLNSFFLPCLVFIGLRPRRRKLRHGLGMGPEKQVCGVPSSSLRLRACLYCFSFWQLVQSKSVLLFILVHGTAS